MNSDPEEQVTNYVRVVLKKVPRKLEEELSYFCFENGAQGVSENLPYVQPELRYDPKIVESAECELSAFFDEAPSVEFFNAIKSEYPEVSAEILTEPTKDWLEEWKKGFEPFVFAEPYWVVPSWRDKPSAAKQVIWVDPGMAFGTGTHETTQLAAQLIVKNWKLMNSPESVLDVGTGTGILAILCEKQGSSKNIGVDIDPECRRVSRENAANNKVQACEFPDYNVEDVSLKFDLVIANIIDGVLLELKPELLERRNPEGFMVLSGILTDREEEFKKKFLADSGLRILERTQKNEWIALLLGK